MNEAIVRYLENKIFTSVDTAIILGSGLGSFADVIEYQTKISTNLIPHYPQSTVPGHSGFIISGKIGQKNLLIFQGRIHPYEGYSIKDVTLPVNIAHHFGAKEIILTNAAGGLNPQLQAGDFMLITDYITSSVAQLNDVAFNQKRFSILAKKYFYDIIPSVQHAAISGKNPLKQGTYLYLTGPSYETRAEIRAFRKMGVDAVGMSTVPEIISSLELGMKTIAISCITNSGSEVRKKISHAEVTNIANSISKSFGSLLLSILNRVD